MGMECRRYSGVEVVVMAQAGDAGVAINSYSYCINTNLLWIQITNVWRNSLCKPQPGN